MGTDSASTTKPDPANATVANSPPQQTDPSAANPLTTPSTIPLATDEVSSTYNNAKSVTSQPKKAGANVKGQAQKESGGGAVAETEKLSPAELKKKAKLEKQARRAKVKQLSEQPSGGAGQASPTSTQDVQSPVAASKRGGLLAGGSKDVAGGPKAQRRGSTAAGAQASGVAGLAALVEAKKKEDKTVAVFGHLYGTHRRSTIAGAGKEVHPVVMALGLQMRDYVVCGSSARCVATLLALKRVSSANVRYLSRRITANEPSQVIESYTTPLGTSLSRHLTTYLSYQITYLSTCRPLSISQGNAIRALKLFISSIDPSVPEETAKLSLYDFIDSFIREKITVADQVIANSAAQKIKDGDVIVTFAGSSIVKQTLLTAHKQGKKFRVSVVDSRPLFEGKNMARALVASGLEVQYTLIHGISHAIKDATKVFLGAHAMTGNGRLYSRVGTALVAMSAKERSGGVEVPVIVCCETVKFTDRVALDSIVVNELADADELVPTHPVQQIIGLPPDSNSSTEQGSKRGAGNAPAKASTAVNAAESLESLTLQQQAPSPLQKWKDTPNLQLLNIMYDVTPAEYVDMIVTEMGSLPPSAVPVVHRMSTNS
jgi:translation initiation factor eIF-2B subunit delta